MVENRKIENAIIDSKIGFIEISASEFRVEKITLNKSFYKNEYTFSILYITAKNIEDYLAGIKVIFEYPLNLDDTSFRSRVLKEIYSIPYGEVASYKEIAERVGHPKAYRAVGTVCAENKYPIIIPCHRVIHSDGRVGKYIGGEVMKRALLDMEKSSNSI